MHPVAAKLAELAGNEVDTVRSDTWKVINSKPWESPVLAVVFQEAVMTAVIRPVAQQTDSKKEVLARIAQLIQWNRQFIASQARRAHETWVTATKYNDKRAVWIAPDTRSQSLVFARECCLNAAGVKRNKTEDAKQDAGNAKKDKMAADLGKLIISERRVKDAGQKWQLTPEGLFQLLDTDLCLVPILTTVLPCKSVAPRLCKKPGVHGRVVDSGRAWLKTAC